MALWNSDGPRSDTLSGPTATGANRSEWPTISERNDGITKRVKVDKVTHRIRFENETESQVTIVIEPKETA